MKETQETDLWKGSRERTRGQNHSLQTNECDPRLGLGSTASGRATRVRAERVVLEGQAAGRRVATAGQSHTPGETIVPVAVCQRPHSRLPEEWPSGGAWRFSRSLEHSVID